MTPTTLSEISHFFDRYTQFTSQEVNQQIEEFFIGFDRLKVGFERIQEEVIEEYRRTAPSYNIFQVLGLSRYETRTHSAMLANLLKPGGSHGQLHLFLEAFLNYCHEAHQDFPIPPGKISEGTWQVFTEYSTSLGRLDIVIRSPDLNYLCVIENKIDAGEQTDQLQRYGDWINSQEQDYPDQVLIYLTIHGAPAYTARDTQYFRLSYQHDIATWLDRIISQIKAPHVREVVIQYRNLVHKL